MITIIDYGVGNLRSIVNILHHLGIDAEITSNLEDINNAKKLLLPGVGSFDYGMTQLLDRGIVDVLNETVIVRKTPILGICLGAQILTRGSEEGVKPGLGWVEADTKRFNVEHMNKKLRIPHMGWSDTAYKKSSRLFSGITEIPRYYYVHSYHMVCDNSDDELSHATYGYDFVSGVEKENIVGVQFHPEKSHQFGMKVLKNFNDNY